MSVSGSIYAIHRLLKHLKVTWWAVRRMDEQNEDWEKRQDIVYRKDKHTCSLWMVCPQHLCLWRNFWSIEKVPWLRLCAKPLVELTDALKRGHETAEKHQISFKEFSFENRKVRVHCRYMGLYPRTAHKSCNPKYQIPDHILIVF